MSLAVPNFPADAAARVAAEADRVRQRRKAFRGPPGAERENDSLSLTAVRSIDATEAPSGATTEDAREDREEHALTPKPRLDLKA